MNFDIQPQNIDLAEVIRTVRYCVRRSSFTAAWPGTFFRSCQSKILKFVLNLANNREI